MKNKFAVPSVCCVILAVGLVGCGSEPDANTELEKAAKALEQADAAQAAPAPAQPAQPVVAAPAAAPQTPVQQMNQAMTYYKSGEYETAMANLQTLRDRATMTPQQNMAVQSAMAAVMTDIYTRAANGDARAQQAVKQYEASKTARPR
jgi:hypothetical protein